jgi:hypothetical protein
MFLDLDSSSTPLIDGLLVVDWIGSITIVGATIALLLGLELGGIIFAWSSTKVLCLLIFGVIITFGFLFNEAKFARYPVVPLRLFTRKPTLAAMAVAFFHGLVKCSISSSASKCADLNDRHTSQHLTTSHFTLKQSEGPLPFNPACSFFRSKYPSRWPAQLQVYSSA